MKLKIFSTILFTTVCSFCSLAMAYLFLQIAIGLFKHGSSSAFDFGLALLVVSCVFVGLIFWFIGQCIDEIKFQRNKNAPRNNEVN